VSRSTIAVLTPFHDDYARRHFYLQFLTERWEREGHRVVVVTERDRFVPADLAILHVDLTIVPPEMRELAARYPLVVNGGLLDIRKRHLAPALAKGDRVDGPVIVKTDWNFRGVLEMKIRIARSPLGGALRAAGLLDQAVAKSVWVAGRLPWSVRPAVSDYLVCESIDDVPDGVWQNPNLVVQRFVAERDGERYCCRHWIFFGDREIQTKTRSASPVVKAGDDVEVLRGPVPASLRRMREELRADYAKIDYGVVEGEIVVYDVNRTLGGAANPEAYAFITDVLAGGLDGFLAQAAAMAPAGPARPELTGAGVPQS
jgi:hypothetical protein